MGGRGPRLPDLNTLMALGLLPRDGILPNDEVKKILRVNDEQIHINRGKWYNFPRGLNGNLVERIIYYRGQGMLCYIRGMERFVFLPFCLNQGLDIYGRYTHGTPIPFNGSAEVVKLEDLKKSKDAMTQILSDLKYQLLYDPVDLDEIAANPDMLFECAVVLSDYTRQLPQTIIPKYKLTEQIIHYESMILPYVNTALMSATGIGGMRVNGQEEQQNVELASRQVQYASLTGMKWLPIDGPVEFQELTGGQVAKAEEFLLVMQSMENYRLGIHGVAIILGGGRSRILSRLLLSRALRTGLSILRQSTADIHQLLLGCFNGILAVTLGSGFQFLNCIVNLLLEIGRNLVTGFAELGLDRRNQLIGRVAGSCQLGKLLVFLGMSLSVSYHSLNLIFRKS